MGKTSENSNWLAGWTLSAPLDELFRETTSSLSATLSDTPGVINISSPDSSFRLELNTDGSMDCRTCAAGFRLILASSSHDSVATAIMLDPSALIIEADESMIEQLSSHPGIEKTIDEAYFFSDEGQHRLCVLIDTQSVPRRIAVVAGTGDREIMCARARGYLIKSAHTLLDTALKQASASPDNGAVDPYELIKSRMHAATSYIPYPWPADTDEEPVWNLALLFPIVHTFLESDTGTAAGMINNILELMDENGNIPAAGGNIGQPILAPASHTLIATMCASYHKGTGKLPSDTNRTLTALVSYLNTALSAWDEDSTHAPPKQAALQMLHAELVSLRYIAKSTGRQADKSIQQVIKEGVAKLEQARDIPETGLAPLLDLMSAIISNRETRDALAESAAQSLQLITDHTDESSMIPCLTIMAANSYKVADYRGYSEWIINIKKSAQRCWSQKTNKSDGVVQVNNRGDQLAYAAMIASSVNQSERAFDRNKLREQRLIQLVEQNKKWIVISGCIVIIALIIFVISVQMRQTMPTSVYETNVGMTLQYYKAKQYEDALNVIKEMEQQGAENYTRIRFLKGKTLFMMDDFTAAAENFTYCIEKKPNSPASYYNLALCLFRNGELDAAAEQFVLTEDMFGARYPSIAAYAKHAQTLIQEMSE